MRQKEFDEWWAELKRKWHTDTIIFKSVIEGITLEDIEDYLEDLHEKAERCDTLEGEIVNLKHTINRL